MEVSSAVEKRVVSLEKSDFKFPAAVNTLAAKNYGSLIYNVESGKPVHQLIISGELKYKKKGVFTYNKSGKTLAEYTAYLMSIFGLSFPPANLASIAFQLIGSKASVTISGTMEVYKMIAKDPATDRVKFYEGTKFSGTVEGISKTLYEGQYPQFISRKDFVVAGWLHNDFWGNYNTPKGW